MKKVRKKIFIITGSIIGILVIISVFYLVKMKSEIRKMHPVPTGLVTDSIYAIFDEFVNVYVVESQGKYIVIDAGNNVQTIEKEMQKLGIDKNDVVAILLTHSDKDHVTSLSMFPNAKIYLAAEEEQMINGQTPRAFIFHNKLERSMDEFLSDGQKITLLGKEIQGILTPGHTPGSMCFLVEGRYLFTGDAMSLHDGETALFNDFFNMDTELPKTSMKKLTGIPGVQYVFTGHYGYGDYTKAFENWK